MKCTCVQCGKTFELSDSEIDFYRKKNLHLPKRCKECRQKNKQKQDMASERSNNWNAREQYAVESVQRNNPNNKQDNNKNSKWKYGVIAVAVLLLILGIKVSFGVFGSNADGQAYSAGDTQNELSSGVDSGQSDSFNTAQTEQNKVADYNESIKPDSNVNAETEQITADSADSTHKDLVDNANPEQAEVPDSTEPVSSDAAVGDTEPELTGNTEPEQTAAADIGTVEPIQESSPVARQYSFRNAKLLEEHYQKHGIEMGFASAEEYQAAASAVVLNENSLHKLEAEDGDDVYYLEATNDFVIVSTDGYIRAYFRPNNGIDYYNRQ